MKIVAIDKSIVQQLRPRLEQVLKGRNELGNLVPAIGNAKYSDTSVTFQVTLSVINAEGQAETPERTAYKQLASLYGLPTDGLGKSFTVESGVVYEITGLAPGRSKYPVLAIRKADGKRFKFPVSEITRRTLS